MRVMDSVHDCDDCIDWNITNVFLYQFLRLVGIMPAKSYPHRFLDFSSLCHQGKVTRENFPRLQPCTSFAWFNHESTATPRLSVRFCTCKHFRRHTISGLQSLLFHWCSHYSSTRTQRASTKSRALLLLVTVFSTYMFLGVQLPICL